MLLAIGFGLVGYLTGRLTAASGRALAVGVILLAGLLAAPIFIGQPWLVLVAALGLVPGYVRGTRRSLRRTLGARQHIDLTRSTPSTRLSGSHQVTAAVRRPPRRPQQQTQG